MVGNIRNMTPDDDTQLSLRDRLRAIPSLVGNPVGFDPRVCPPAPRELFLQWFRIAEQGGVPEPHAMTVSTVDAAELPDSRMLVLKDITPEGAWCFAGNRDSTKGLQLQANPVAALLFYWREQLRSVRLRGSVTQSTQEESRNDFLARSLQARAAALSGRQSTALDAGSTLTAEVEEAGARLEADPGLVPDQWTVWQLHPTEVEFWEGSGTRLHTRLRYERTDDGWSTSLLRP